MANNRSKTYGIGINDMPIGWIDEGNNFKTYDVWRHILLRTTDKFQENKYPTYKGTTVCEEWKTLSKFIKDIKELDGYEDWASKPELKMMLDKDTKILGNKHYSKDTCCFISHADSNRDVANRHPEVLEKAREIMIEKYSIPLKAFNKKTKEILYFSSLKELCRVLKLNYRHVWMIISDEEKYKSHKSTKGWVIVKDTGKSDEEYFKEYLFDNTKEEKVKNSKKISKSNKEYKKYYCPYCHKEIKKSSKMCSDCYKELERKNSNKPSKEELEQLIYKYSFVQIGEKFKVSDNTIRKWCKSYNFPSDYKTIKENKKLNKSI